jgi:hypothetical protein
MKQVGLRTGQGHPPYSKVPGDRRVALPQVLDITVPRRAFVMKLRTIIAGPIALVAAGLLLSACGHASQIPGSAAISPAAAAATFRQPHRARRPSRQRPQRRRRWRRSAPSVRCWSARTATRCVDPSLVTTVDRPDGSKQLKIGKWPLYFYTGDGAPGDANGQGVNGKWFAIDGKCKLVQTDA